jgi:4-amino-4-deoxy-L-arabinose transferase-like glycosyltransferase
MSRKTRIILPTVAVVALALRLAFCAWVVGFDTPPKADEADYHMIAANIADGDGFVDDNGVPTGRRAPAYPAFLSAIYRVTGPRTGVARLMQTLLGAVIVLLTFSVARRHFGEAAGLIAAALTALNPFLIFVSGYALSENLYVVLLLLALRALPQPVARDEPPSRWLVGAVILALALLVRPGGMPLALWIVAAVVVTARVDLTTRLAQSAMVVLVLAAVLLPWAFRNQSTFGDWVGLTTHGGVTFYQGNNQEVVDIPHYRGGVAPLAALPEFDRLAQMNEAERDKESYRLGREFLRENPELIPRLVWWKFKRFWRLRSDMGLSGIRSGWWFSKDSALGRVAAEFDAGLVYAVVSFPLMCVGLFLSRRRWRNLAFLYGVIVAHTAVGLAFHGSIRGRVPIEPVIAVFAAAAVVELFKRVRRPESA